MCKDIRSLILLEKNGRASSSKCTRHIAFWYFFVTNWTEKGELSVETIKPGNNVSIKNGPAKFLAMKIPIASKQQSWRALARVWGITRICATGVCWES